MGLDVTFQKIDMHYEIFSFIELQWNEQNDTKCSFVEPYLITSVKWKYDYVIFHKNFWWNKQMEIKFKRYSENAIIPKRATVGSADYDLYSAVDTNLIPVKPELIRTDVILEVPYGFYGKVIGRSRLALPGISTHIGTPDSGFRRIVCVILTKKFLRV